MKFGLELSLAKVSLAKEGSWEKLRVYFICVGKNLEGSSHETVCWHSEDSSGNHDAGAVRQWAVSAFPLSACALEGKQIPRVKLCDATVAIISRLLGFHWSLFHQNWHLYESDRGTRNLSLRPPGTSNLLFLGLIQFSGPALQLSPSDSGHFHHDYYHWFNKQASWQYGDAFHNLSSCFLCTLNFVRWQNSSFHFLITLKKDWWMVLTISFVYKRTKDLERRVESDVWGKCVMIW